MRSFRRARRCAATRSRPAIRFAVPMAYGLWTAAYRLPPTRSADIPRIFLASAALASLKCYAGSFVDFLRLIEQLRGTSAWKALWQWPR